MCCVMNILEKSLDQASLSPDLDDLHVKPFYTAIVFLKNSFKKVYLKKADDNKSMKNDPACKELGYALFIMGRYTT